MHKGRVEARFGRKPPTNLPDAHLKRRNSPPNPHQAAIYGLCERDKDAPGQAWGRYCATRYQLSTPNRSVAPNGWKHVC